MIKAEIGGAIIDINDNGDKILTFLPVRFTDRSYGCTIKNEPEIKLPNFFDGEEYADVLFSRYIDEMSSKIETQAWTHGDGWANMTPEDYESDETLNELFDELISVLRVFGISVLTFSVNWGLGFHDGETDLWHVRNEFKERYPDQLSNEARQNLL